MSESVVLFVLALVFAIPTGIASALAASRIERWLSKRNEMSLAERMEDEAAFVARVKQFANDPDGFSLYRWAIAIVTIRRAFIPLAVLLFVAPLQIASDALASHGVSVNRDLIAFAQVSGCSFAISFTYVMVVDRLKGLLEVIGAVYTLNHPPNDAGAADDPVDAEKPPASG